MQKKTTMKRNNRLPDKIKQQLSSRYHDKNLKIYRGNTKGGFDLPMASILCASCDEGVIRNGGRLGARFGPKVILHELSKFQFSSHRKLAIKVDYVQSNSRIEEDFEERQSQQQNCILQLLKDGIDHPVIHLGGGHDHIFPLLLALQSTGRKLNILNIDAHLDTRIDDAFHSGTPFRQFDIKAHSSYKLEQFGIQTEANAKSNFKELIKGKMTIHEKIDSFSSVIDTNKSSLNILSIDVDGISSRDFKSCSAVNPSGIADEKLNDIIEIYKEKIQHPPVVGFYEYNPLYDDLSNSDGKKIAWKINQLLK